MVKFEKFFGRGTAEYLMWTGKIIEASKNHNMAPP